MERGSVQGVWESAAERNRRIVLDECFELAYGGDCEVHSDMAEWSKAHDR